MRRGSLLVVATLAFVFPILASAAIGSTVLTVELERAGRPGLEFKECENCPAMIVVPPGSATMGSPPSETAAEPEFEDLGRERPQHEVTLARPFRSPSPSSR
jgi:formylglycine-generating enzyme required for sulfatase activity